MNPIHEAEKNIIDILIDLERLTGRSIKSAEYVLIDTTSMQDRMPRYCKEFHIELWPKPGERNG